MGAMWRLRSWFALVAVVLVWEYGAQAVQFEVSSRTTKCIAEEIQSHVVVVGDYKIVHSDEAHKLTVKVLVAWPLINWLFCCCMFRAARVWISR
jgi:hypothetical protein